MILVGVLILVAATTAIAIAVTGGTSPTEITFGSLRIESTTAGFFLSGIVITSVLLIGVWFVGVGIARWRRRRAELETLQHPSSGPADPEDQTVGIPEQAQPRHDILPPIGPREERVHQDPP